MKVTDQIRVVEREIALRVTCYPRWVQKGTMKQEQATHELAGMRAVLQTLKESQYIETIPAGGVRVEIRGLTKDGRRHAVVKVEKDVNNDTLLITLCRDSAVEFWKFFSKETT